MQVEYTKMNGCRNDYIFVDNSDDQYPDLKRPDLSAIVKKISNRKTGIGSDGLIILEKPLSEDKDTVFRMKMFNADGSEGKMCGNGIRCVAKLAFEKFGARPSYKIATASGIRECFVMDATNRDRFMVKVNMGRPSFLPAKIPVIFDDMMVLDEEFEVDGEAFRISCVSIGNPHCVIPIKNLETFDIARFGPKISTHEVFPEGVNVEFIEAKDGKIFQRTWERGSGETQACGTGACAVGVIKLMQVKQKAPLEIHLRGGTLSIEWDGLREVWMTGDAVTEGKGSFEI